MGQGQLKLYASFGDEFVPSANSARGIANIIISQTHINGRQRRNFLGNDLAIHAIAHSLTVMFQLVIILDPLLHISALDTGVERIGRIGRDFLTKQIKGQ